MQEKKQRCYKLLLIESIAIKVKCTDRGIKKYSIKAEF
jgi:hypothetical protein